MSTTAFIPTFVAGCNRCGTRWADRAVDCWMCGRPGEQVNRPAMGDGCERGAVGMYGDILAAKKAGPCLSDDPCGGGPL